MFDIDKFADRMGLARDFIDADGKYTVITPEARRATLEAMGYDLSDEETLQERVLKEELQPYRDLIDPVTVIREGERPFIMIRTPERLSESAVVDWTLTLEDGTIYQGHDLLSDIEIASFETVQDRVYDTRRFILPNELLFATCTLPAAKSAAKNSNVAGSAVSKAVSLTPAGSSLASDQGVSCCDGGQLPLGYHHFKLTITDGVVKHESIDQLLILTPLKCYVPAPMQQGKKLWGASVQLYTLRSRNNWGVGDFNDLKQVLKIVHDRGGEFVGLNPLHAGYPANPDPDMVSPYSPSSRRWLNIIYISVNNVPEFLNSPKARELVQSPAFAKKLQALRDREYVDYKAVLDLKLKVLHMIFDMKRMLDKRSNRSKQFLDFIAQGGPALLNMATYDALQYELYAKGINAWGWQKFPKEYQDCNSPFVEQWREKNKEQVYFYCYLQFLAHEQLDEAFAVAQSEGMILGTYRDLAVGVSEGSCDVWADTDHVYRGAAEVGAPPDTLGPLGQSWGLAPMEPHALRRSQYKAIIDLYRANMRACGALRIDHAAGLYRFWWVPVNHKPTEGAYVYNNIHDWLGILALESQRHKCLIIAEDLGTIPMELRVALKEVGAYSYKLFFGERAYDGGFIAPQDYEPQALSALTTHDMATLVGWWSNYDLELGQSLGIYTEEVAKSLRVQRDDAKQRILDSLHGLGSVGDEVPRRASDIPEMTHDLVKGLERHMCRGSCALFSSQIEDWIGVLKPVNVPGTFREYPNWRRKLTQNLEDIDKDVFVRELTSTMTVGREEASLRDAKYKQSRGLDL